MKYLNYQNLILFFRFIIGLIFIYASIDKILNPLAFSNIIDNYHITPQELNNLAALIIPWVELVAGIFLILGIFINGSSFIIIILLVFFIFILTQALFRGINVHCGCFNLAEQSSDVNLRIEMINRILQDALFLFMAFLIKRNNKW